MAITPSGTVPWTRTVAHTDYGGNVDKQNHLTRGKIDALTDVSAEDLCRIAADLQAVVRAMPFATITYACRDDSTQAPLVRCAYMQTAVRLTSYDSTSGSQPTGFPYAVRNGDGDATFTFPSTYTDEYGVTGSWAPRQCIASLHGTTSGAVAYEITDQEIQLFAVNNSGAIADAVVTFSVW